MANLPVKGSIGFIIFLSVFFVSSIITIVVSKDSSLPSYIKTACWTLSIGMFLCVLQCITYLNEYKKLIEQKNVREDEVILFAAQFQDRGGDDRDGENDAQPIEIDLRFLQRVIFERHRSDDDPKAKNQQRQHNPVSHPADRRRQRHVETAFLVRDLWVFSLSTLNQQHEGGADQQ